MLQLKNKYKNKKFSILGDSISTLEGYSEPKTAVHYNHSYQPISGVRSISDTWWGQVIEQLEGKLLVNNSWSGSTVSRHPLYEIPSYGCSEERTSTLGKDGETPDVILVFMGINDWGMGMRSASNPLVKGSENDLSIFSVAYRVMLEKLKSNYPQAEIWCMTLPISRCTREENYQFNYYSRGRHLAEYCEGIEKSGKECGCHVIDLYRLEERYDTVDGAHPTVSGMTTLARAVLEAMQEEK